MLVSSIIQQRSNPVFAPIKSWIAASSSFLEGDERLLFAMTDPSAAFADRPSRRLKMSLAPLLNAPLVVQLHALAAMAALVLGIVQLVAPKGTFRIARSVGCG